MLVTLVDLGLGNINSLYNSFKKIGVELNVSNNIKEIDKSDKLILPGVGAFNYAIKRINNLEIYDSILEFNHKKKYILGLCLGMQLFFLDSEENTITKGLGILEGNIKSIKNDMKELKKILLCRNADTVVKLTDKQLSEEATTSWFWS